MNSDQFFKKLLSNNPFRVVGTGQRNVANISEGRVLSDWAARSHPQAYVAALSGGFTLTADRFAGQGFSIYASECIQWTTFFTYSLEIMGRLDCVIAWLVRSILSCWQSEGSEFRVETTECSSKALLKIQQVMHRNVELGLSRDKRPEVLWRGGEEKIIWEGEELHRYDCGVNNGNSFTRELLVQKGGFLMEVGFCESFQCRVWLSSSRGWRQRWPPRNVRWETKIGI